MLEPCLLQPCFHVAGCMAARQMCAKGFCLWGVSATRHSVSYPVSYPCSTPRFWKSVSYPFHTPVSYSPKGYGTHDFPLTERVLCQLSCRGCCTLASELYAKTASVRFSATRRSEHSTGSETATARPPRQKYYYYLYYYHYYYALLYYMFYYMFYMFYVIICCIYLYYN